MAYGPIGGPLPFSGGGRDYASAYNSALNFNSKNYSQILQGYQSTAAAQQQEQQRILGGYGALQGNVMGSIAGIDQSQRQGIADTYAQNVGQTSQQLISRGLGNSTVQQSVARGLLYDKTKSDINLTNQTQGLNAQYMSQLGLAGLGYQERANQQNTSLAEQQLGWMNSINAAYPDARAYAQLAMMKGQAGGGGFTMPGGVPGSGGAVKSPLGPGGGSSSPGYYGAGYSGGGVAQRPNVSGYSTSLTPEASTFSSGAAGDFGGGGGNYDWETNNGSFSSTPSNGGWQDWNGEDLTGYSYNGQTINDQGYDSGGGDY